MDTDIGTHPIVAAEAAMPCTDKKMPLYSGIFYSKLNSASVGLLIALTEPTRDRILS